jgi:outer membrane usher protein FimD/PapC
MSLATYRFGTSTIQNFSEAMETAAVKLSRQTTVPFPEIERVEKVENTEQPIASNIRSFNLSGIRETMRSFSSPTYTARPQAPSIHEVNLNWNFSIAK